MADNKYGPLNTPSAPTNAELIPGVRAGLKSQFGGVEEKHIMGGPDGSIPYTALIAKRDANGKAGVEVGIPDDNRYAIRTGASNPDDVRKLGDIVLDAAHQARARSKSMPSPGGH